MVIMKVLENVDIILIYYFAQNIPGELNCLIVKVHD